jgi:hypothetical protein
MMGGERWGEGICGGSIVWFGGELGTFWTPE